MIRIVSYDEIVGGEYLTISARGVSYYSKEEINFTALDDYKLEYQCYLKLMKVRLEDQMILYTLINRIFEHFFRRKRSERLAFGRHLPFGENESQGESSILQNNLCLRICLSLMTL